MSDDYRPEDYPNDYSDPNAVESKLEELEQRLDDFESRAFGGGGSDSGGVFCYFFGCVLAMILSWSRNGGILYCIGHGILSWAYVIYFALSR